MAEKTWVNMTHEERQAVRRILTLLEMCDSMFYNDLGLQDRKSMVDFSTLDNAYSDVLEAIHKMEVVFSG